MRQRWIVLALSAACLLTACQSRAPRQSAKPDDVQTVSGSPAASASSEAKTPDQAQSEARQRATQQVRINQLQDIVAELKTQGVEVHKTPVKKAWRLIIPALEKVKNPVERKRQADQIAADFRRRIEPVMERRIDVEVYLDKQEKRPIQ